MLGLLDSLASSWSRNCSAIAGGRGPSRYSQTPFEATPLRRFSTVYPPNCGFLMCRNCAEMEASPWAVMRASSRSVSQVSHSAAESITSRITSNCVRSRSRSSRASYSGPNVLIRFGPVSNFQFQMFCPTGAPDCVGQQGLTFGAYCGAGTHSASSLSTLNSQLSTLNCPCPHAPDMHEAVLPHHAHRHPPQPRRGINSPANAVVRHGLRQSHAHCHAMGRAFDFSQ